MVKDPPRKEKEIIEATGSIGGTVLESKICLSQFVQSPQPGLYGKRMAHALIATTNKSTQPSLFPATEILFFLGFLICKAEWNISSAKG